MRKTASLVCRGNGAYQELYTCRDGSDRLRANAMLRTLVPKDLKGQRPEASVKSLLIPKGGEQK